MFDELLRTSHRRALHRQVRAERARQCVDAGRHLGPRGSVANPRPDALPSGRRAIVSTEHAPTAAMPLLA